MLNVVKQLEDEINKIKIRIERKNSTGLALFSRDFNQVEKAYDDFIEFKKEENLQFKEILENLKNSRIEIRTVMEQEWNDVFKKVDDRDNNFKNLMNEFSMIKNNLKRNEIVLTQDQEEEINSKSKEIKSIDLKDKLVKKLFESENLFEKMENSKKDTKSSHKP